MIAYGYPLLDQPPAPDQSAETMALGSIFLSLLAGLLTFLGFLTVLVPGWGAALSFLAPLCACGGLILGGLGLSKAKQAGRSRDVPVLAIVLNILVLLPAFAVAMTCGVCNAVGSSGSFEVHRSFHVQMTFPEPSDGGRPPGFDAPPPLPNDAGLPEDGALPEEDELDSDGLPPPPLPAGPTGLRRL